MWDGVLGKMYLIVAGVGSVECGMDFVFDRVEGVQY